MRDSRKAVRPSSRSQPAFACSPSSLPPSPERRLSNRLLENVYYLGSHALEGFRVLNAGAPGNTTRMVGAILRDLRLVLVQVTLRGHGLHSLLLERKHCGNIDKCVGNESAVFRLMRLKQKEFRRFDSGETTGDA